MNVLSWLRLAIVNWHQLVLFLVGTSGHLGAFLIAQLIKNPPAMRETWVRCLVGKIPWRRERLPTPVFLPGEFHGLYSSCSCRVKTQLSDFHFPFPWKKSEFHSLHFWTLKVRVRSFINSYPSLKWQFPGPLWSLLMPEFEEILPTSPSIHSSIHPTSHPFT